MARAVVHGPRVLKGTPPVAGSWRYASSRTARRSCAVRRPVWQCARAQPCRSLLMSGWLVAADDGDRKHQSASARPLRRPGNCNRKRTEPPPHARARMLTWVRRRGWGMGVIDRGWWQAPAFVLRRHAPDGMSPCPSSVVRGVADNGMEVGLVGMLMRSRRRRRWGLTHSGDRAGRDHQSTEMAVRLRPRRHLSGSAARRPQYHTHRCGVRSAAGDV